MLWVKRKAVYFIRVGAKGGQRNKWYKSSHHHQTHTQTALEQEALWKKCLPVFLLPSIMSYSMDNSFCQFGSPLCPCALSLLTGRGEWGETVPWGSARAGQQELKHWCVFNTVWVSQPRHSTIEAVRKKINPISLHTSKNMSRYPFRAPLVSGRLRVLFPLTGLSAGRVFQRRALRGSSAPWLLASAWKVSDGTRDLKTDIQAKVQAYTLITKLMHSFSATLNKPRWLSVNQIQGPLDSWLHVASAIQVFLAHSPFLKFALSHQLQEVQGIIHCNALVLL